MEVPFLEGDYDFGAKDDVGETDGEASDDICVDTAPPSVTLLFSEKTQDDVRSVFSKTSYISGYLYPPGEFDQRGKLVIHNSLTDCLTEVGDGEGDHFCLAPVLESTW